MGWIDTTAIDNLEWTQRTTNLTRFKYPERTHNDRGEQLWQAQSEYKYQMVNESTLFFCSPIFLILNVESHLLVLSHYSGYHP